MSTKGVSDRARTAGRTVAMVLIGSGVAIVMIGWLALLLWLGSEAVKAVVYRL